MRNYEKFYIDGEWVTPVELKTLDVENPATEQACGKIALGLAADVDRAVKAARNAFASWSQSSRQERIELLQSILAEYQKRAADMAAAVTEEMGAPASLAQNNHVPLGSGHINVAIEVLKKFAFEEQRGATLITKESIGVCGLITPWNWPLNQIAVKVAPAIATGCTMILKPSEIAPFSGQIFAEVMQAAGVPAGVFNMIHGNGPGVGAALSSHPDVDMISFTGSTRAGSEITKNSAATIKRLSLELGGKSPRIVLDDAMFAAGVNMGVASMMGNCGQTCAAGSRLLVPSHRMNEAIIIARDAVAQITVGDPNTNVRMGPASSKVQFDKIQRLIQIGIDEGAILIAGGIGRPEGLSKGHYVKPTVFANVTNAMTIAREEIFGPVLCIIGYDDIEQAVAIANDTEYGLAAYIHAADIDKARAIARRIRSGQVSLNNAFDFSAPFGGFKKSGNGREWGEWGFEEFLELKAILGFAQ